MALQVVLKGTLTEKSEEVQFFKSETALLSVEQLEAMFKEVLQKFQLKEIFHNMRGMHSHEYIESSQYERKRIQVKEEGFARIYGNGKTMLAMHSYEVEKKVLTTEHLHCPLIYVIGSDKDETKRISNEIRIVLLQRLCHEYTQVSSVAERDAIAVDIAKNITRMPLPLTKHEVRKDLDAIIDEELEALVRQLFNRVLSYENSTANGPTA